MAEKDRDVTKITCQSTYKNLRVPFDLTNAPATFWRTLDISLSGINWRTCLIYLNNVIMFSKLFDAHLEDVDMLLSTLRDAGVFQNLKKYSFSTDSEKYFGDIIKSGVSTIN